MLRPLHIAILLLFVLLAAAFSPAGGENLPAGALGPDEVLLLDGKYEAFIQRALAELRRARTDEEVLDALEVVRLCAVKVPRAALQNAVSFIGSLPMPPGVSSRTRLAVRAVLRDLRVMAGTFYPETAAAEEWITSLKMMPPFHFSGDEAAENRLVSFVASAYGDEPVGRTSSTGLFRPAVDCAPYAEPGKWALYGTSFEAEGGMSVSIAVTSNRELAFYIDVPPLRMTEDGSVLLREPDLESPGTPGMSPLAPTALLRLQPSKGRHTLFVLVSAAPGGYFSLSALSQDGEPRPFAPLPCSKKDFYSEGQNIKNKMQSADIVFFKSDAGRCLLFPSAGVSLDEWLRRRDGFSLKDARDILEADFLLGLSVRGAAADFAEKAARSVLSPLVSDWLDRLASPALADYDRRCLKRFPRADGPWLRRRLSAMDPAEKEKALLAFIRDNGPSLRLLDELASLGSPNAVEAAFQYLAQVPFHPAFSAKLAASEALSFEDRISIISQLQKAGAGTFSLYVERVRLLTLSGDLDSAAEYCAELCRNYPWAAKPWADLGGIYRLSGRPSLCVRAWRAALALDPDYPHLGVLLEEAEAEAAKSTGYLGITPPELKALREKAAELPSPLGLAELKREYALQVSSSGRIEGTVYRLILFTRDVERLNFSPALKEWEGRTLSVELRRCVLYDPDGTERLASVEDGAISVRRAVKGSTLEIAQHVRLEPDALFAPGAFDFIPAVRIGLPLVAFRYELKTPRPVSWWTSPGLAGRFEDGVLLVKNERPLVFCTPPLPSLPSFGWSDLGPEDISSAVLRELDSWGGLAVERVGKLASRTGTPRARLVADFNALRALMAPREAPPGRFFEARRPGLVFATGRASAFEFAGLLSAALKESGVDGRLTVALLCEEGAFPWRVPEPGEFFCPALATDILFALDDGEGSLLLRCLSPLPARADRSHFCRAASSLMLFPYPSLLAIKGLEGKDGVSWRLSLSASERGEVSCSAEFVMSGVPAEDFASATGGDPQKAASALVRLLSGWLGPVRGIGENIDVQAGGDSLRIKAPYFILDWVKRPISARRFALSPSPPDLGRIVKEEDGAFRPAWSGELQFGITVNSALSFILPEGKETDESAPFGRFLLKVGKGKRGEVLYALVRFEPGPFAPGREPEFTAFAKKAESILSAVVCWKRAGEKNK